MKNKKLSYSFLAVALALTVGMLFMGFAPFIKVNFNGTLKFSLWDYIFVQGKCSEYSYITSCKYRVWLIIAFALMLLAICALISHLVIKSKNFTGKKLDIVMLSCVSSVLVIASILIFISRTYAIAEIPEVVRDALKEYVKLGWGAIVSGTLGILATGAMFTWFFTHPQS